MRKVLHHIALGLLLCSMGCEDLFDSDDKKPEDPPAPTESQLYAPPPNPRNAALEILEISLSNMGHYFKSPQRAKGDKSNTCRFPSTLDWDNVWSNFDPYVATPGDGCIQIKVQSVGTDSEARATLLSRYRDDNCQGDWVVLKQTVQGTKDLVENKCQLGEVGPPVQLPPGTPIP